MVLKPVVPLQHVNSTEVNDGAVEKNVFNSKLAEIGTDKNFKHKIVWPNAIGFLLLHLAAVYGYYLILKGEIGLKSIVLDMLLVHLSLEGIRMGAHRLYTHKSFKAKLPVRAALVMFQTISGQNSMWEWVRDHRQHHKYSDTDADPHNATRGLFFSHIGWLMSRKHPKVIEYGKKIDMSDVEADEWVMFQKQHYMKLYLLIGFALPILIPVLLWDEDIVTSFFVMWAARLVTQLNSTWMVNSAAHYFGYKPYDSKMRPVECLITALCANGEGWHNYHHSFPWDYRAAEIGMIFNNTAMYIELLERLGLASDLKSASAKMIESQRDRSGDGTVTQMKDLSYVRRFLILSSMQLKSLGCPGFSDKSDEKPKNE